MNVAFLNHGFLVQKECINALRARPDISLTVIDTATFASPEQASETCDQLRKHQIRLVFTINEWGMDLDGRIRDFLSANSILHVNWCTDDPFFIEIILDIPSVPSPGRLDFVTDREYVRPMKERGFDIDFLPLAADPSVFAPAIPPRKWVRDCAFVGSSYFEDLFMKYAKGHDSFMEQTVDFVAGLARNVLKNVHVAIVPNVDKYFQDRELPQGLSLSKAKFLVCHAVGFFVRKGLVAEIARTLPDFMVFGDAFWTAYVPENRVSMAVAYYDNLCSTYQETRVNIDINRVVIRQGFTQRIMDCLASESFVLTSDKAILGEYFITDGPQSHLAVFENQNDMIDKINYFRIRDRERQEIARRGRVVVLAHHTYAARINTIMHKAMSLLT